MTENKNTQISGAEILMRALLDEGVTTLFGYPGGAIMPVYDALYDYRDRLNHILVRHEQAAAHAAEGYARVSGRTGVCLVTSGPGATNTITGIADAMMDSTPMVVITGQVGAQMLGTDAFQECDVVDITQPISKWAYQIRSAKDVAWAVHRAFYIAASGRPGPVVLDFAKNAQIEKADYLPGTIDFIRSYVPVPPTDKQSLAEAAALINEAKRPLVLVGQGVELGNAGEELRAFIEKAGLPAGCTLLGLSALPTNHPLNVGMLGMHGSLGANKKTQECDLLIAVGMRFDDRITGKLDTYAKQARKIHFDIDPSEINKNVTVDVAVLGDCKETLPAVTALLEQKAHTEWRESFRQWDSKEHEVVIEPQIHPAEGPLSCNRTQSGQGGVGNRCGTEPNDGGTLFPFYRKAQHHNLGRYGHHGIWIAGCHWCHIRCARPHCVLVPWRWRIANDHRRVWHHHGAACSSQNHIAQQQFLGQCATVAAAVLPPSLFVHTHDEPRLREDSRGLQHTGTDRHRPKQA